MFYLVTVEQLALLIVLFCSELYVTALWPICLETLWMYLLINYCLTIAIECLMWLINVPIYALHFI